MTEEPCVLIVDDDEGTRKTLSLILKEKGFQPITAGTGTEAQAYLSESACDIALIDLKLPDTSGIDLLHGILRDHQDTDTVIITGHASLDTAIQALNDGAAAYLTKPLDLDEVLHTINRIIAHQQLLRDKRRADDRIEHLNAVLRGIRNVNQLITQVNDRNVLLQGSCDNLTETLGYQLAWIILRNEDGTTRGAFASGDPEAVSYILDRVNLGKEIPCDLRAMETGGFVMVLDPGEECPNCVIPGTIENSSAFCTQLIYQGVRYGTLTVVVPQQFAQEGEEQDLFCEVAGDITFALHRLDLEDERIAREHEIYALSSRYKAILDSAPDIIMEVNEDKKYTFANEAGLTFFGPDVIGREASDYFQGEQDVYASVQSIFNGSENVIYVESLQLRHDKAVRLLAWWCRVLKDERGNVIGALSTARDITEEREYEEAILRSLTEKEILLKEIHHRVKNNLQIISSLLDLQADSIDDDHVRELFKVSQNRIRTMALVHGTLYGTDNISMIDCSDYVRSLVDYLSSIFLRNSSNIAITVSIDDIQLNIDRAVPVGIILNELITNSMKYAFPGSQPGSIRISMERTTDDHIILDIADDGVGIPAEIDPEHSLTLGLQLVYMLVHQIKGSVKIDRTDGTRFIISFPT
jgi:PAS domain S-box-containing protein